MKLPIEQELRYWSEARKQDLSLAQRDLAIAEHLRQLNREKAEWGVKIPYVRSAVSEKVVFSRPKDVRPVDPTSYKEVVVRAHLLGNGK